MSFSGSLKWTTKTPLTSPKSNGAADFVNGKLYVIDGTPGAGFLSNILVYDTTLNTWRTDNATDLVARDNLASAVDASGNIYLIDGLNGSGVLSQVTRFNPFSDTVVQVASTSVAREFAAAATGANGHIYVFGGEGSGSAILSSGEVYDPNTNAWTAITAMPKALAGASAVAAGSLIYVIGGEDSSLAPSSSVYVYNTNTNVWNTLSSLPTAVKDAAAGLVNGEIVVAGGVGSGGDVATTQIYDPASDTWTTGSSMSTAEAFAGQGMISSGKHLFVAGGDGNTQALQTAAVAPADGQIYFRINQASDVQLGNINSDGTARHTIYTGGGFNTGTNGNETSVAVDTAAGLVFSVGIGNTGSYDAFSVHNLNTGALISTTEFGPNTGSAANDDVVQALTINPFTHKLYVGDWGTDTAQTGIREFTYTPGSGALTPLASNGGFLVTASQNPQITNAIAMYVDTANHKLYYVDDDSGYNFSPFPATNGVYVLDLNSPSSSTELTSNASGAGQFPVADQSGASTFIGAHGNIVGLTVDVADGIVFFESTDVQGSSNNALWWVSASGGANQTAHQIALPAGVTLNFAGQSSTGGDAAGLTFDPILKQLYLSDAENSTTTRDTGRLYVLQWNNTNHTVSTVTSFDTASLVGTSASTVDPIDAISTTAFDNLPTLTTGGTTTHVVEQGTVVTLLSATPTITDIDGDHLASATVQITGGTFTVPGNGNDSSASDDHLTINGTASGTIGAITYSYVSATETLTLTGYDTLANYQSALALVKYNTTGNNPTDYGLNPTRTITWQANDGAIGNPSGTNTTNTTLTIDGVNNAPVANAPATYTAAERVALNLHNASLNVSDVDGGITGQNEVATLSVTEGTLHVVAGTGASSGAIIGNNDSSSVTITGTIAQINGILNSDNTSTLTFTGNIDANDSPNSTTLSLKINDNGLNGVPPPGAFDSNIAQSAITAPDDTTVTFHGLSSDTTGSPVQGQQITATIGSDGGLTVGSATYTWKVAGTVVQSSSANTYTPTEMDEGKALTLDVSFNDPGNAAISETETGIAVGSSATVQETATSDTVVSLTGLNGSNNAVHGTAVTASVTDGASAVSGVTYTWKVAGTVVGGSGNSYTPVEADEGKALTVNVSFTDVAGNAETGSANGGTVQETATSDTLVSLGGLTGGNAVQGTAVTATVTDGGSAVSGATYTWKVAGTVVGGSGNSYTPTEGDEGKALTVDVSFTDVAGNAETGSTNGGTVQETGTSDTVVSLSGLTGGNAVHGTAVTASITDGGLAVSGATYTWKAAGTVVGGSGNSYTPVEADEGQALTVDVSFTDANGIAETGSQSAGTVQEITPDDTVVTLGGLTGGNAVHGTAVTASVTDGSAAVSGAIYTWKVAGSVVGGSGNSYTPVEADEGKALTVNVSFTDVAGNAETGSANGGTVQEITPDDTVVSLSGLTGGNAVHGTAVTATVTDGGSAVSSATYTWKVAGTVVGGSGNSYTPVEADEGKALTVNVSFTDVAGNAETGSATGGTVQESPTENATFALTGLTSGNAVQGQQVTATVTEPDAPASGITYTWKVNGSTVHTGVDAAGSTYTPSEADEGLPISVAVSFTDTNGFTETGAQSAGTVQESPGEPPNVALINRVTPTGTTDQDTLSGTAEAGTTVKVFDGLNQVGSGVTVDGTGHWSLTTSVLAVGQHSFTASVTDGGVTGPPSAALQIGVFSHPKSEYTITDSVQNDNQRHWHVVDNGPGHDPTTDLTGPEYLQFSDHFFSTHNGNYDGARYDDVLLQNQSNGGVVFAAMQNGSFLNWGAATGNLGSIFVGGIGDVNGDGFADVFVQDPGNSNSIYVAEQHNTGSPTWIVATNQLNADWKLVGAGDINGDLYTDFVVQAQSTGSVVYGSMANGVFSGWGTVAYNLGNTKVVGVGDINGDGFADVVTQNQSTGQIAYANMQGGVFHNWVNVATTPNFKVVAVGDVTGDGFADVVVQNPTTGEASIADMHNGVFTQFLSALPGNNPDLKIMAAADVNADGRKELLIQQASTGFLSYANEGPTGFSNFGNVNSSPGLGAFKIVDPAVDNAGAHVALLNQFVAAGFGARMRGGQSDGQTRHDSNDNNAAMLTSPVQLTSDENHQAESAVGVLRHHYG
jgi:hypothetical protein